MEMEQARARNRQQLQTHRMAFTSCTNALPIVRSLYRSLSLLSLVSGLSRLGDSQPQTMWNRFVRAYFLFGQVSSAFLILISGRWQQARCVIRQLLASVASHRGSFYIFGVPVQNQVMRRAKLLVLVGYWCCVVETTTTAPRPRQETAKIATTTTTTTTTTATLIRECVWVRSECVSESAVKRLNYEYMSVCETKTK